MSGTGADAAPAPKIGAPVVCGLIVAAAVVALLAYQRRFFAYGTESDFLWAYKVLAERFLAGQPLHLWSYPGQPPGYSLVLACVYRVLGDWFAAGLLLSVASSIAVMAASFVFFHRLLGPAAAWGSLVGLATCSVFLRYSCLATSDVFFLGVYSVCLASAQAALRPGPQWRWALCGALAGMVIMSRLNGLTILVLAALPWASPAPEKRRLLLLLAAGAAVPLALWTVIALATGSDILPSGVARSLVMTYYSEGPDRVSADADVNAALMERLRSVYDVISHDPGRIASQYLRDYGQMAQRTLGRMLMPVLRGTALTGLFLVIFSRIRRGPSFFWLFLAATLAQTALVNMKAFEERYFLFLVPLLGASAGVLVERVLDALPDRPTRREWGLVAGSLVVIALPLLVMGFQSTYAEVREALYAQDEEFAEAVPAIRKAAAPGEWLLARSPHVPFHAGTKSAFFPSVRSLEDLRLALLNSGDIFPLLVYYGSAERLTRAEVAGLAVPGNQPSWLVPLAASSQRGVWALYRVPSRTRLLAGR